MERISPQVVTITADVAEITQTLRKETTEVKTSAHEVMDRVSKQTQRLDSMLTTSLDAVERAGSIFESAVSKPVRQANGVFAAVRAVVDTYKRVNPRSYQQSAKRPSVVPTAAAEDKDFSI